jgi:hypothetical protein
MMTEVSYPYFQTSLMKEVYSTEGGIDSPRYILAPSITDT